MVINHNISALNTYNKLNANTKAAQNSLEKLSSGLRINRAGDDAAGLAISQKMQAQINGLDQSSSNAQNGISLIQTAEGALNETQSILQRMNTLATQAANDTNTASDRAAMQQEVNQLTQEIDRIGNTTQFNTKDLLNGGAGTQVQFAAGSGLKVVGGSAGVTTGTTFNIASVTKATSADVTITAGANGEDLKTGTAGASFAINGVSFNLAAGATGDDIAAAINAQSDVTGVTAAYTDSTTGTKGQLVLSSSQEGSSGEIKLTGLLVDTNSGTAGNPDPADEIVSGAGTNKIAISDNSGAVTLPAGASYTSNIDTYGADATATVTGTSGTVTVSGNGNVITLQGTGTGVDGLQLDVSNATTTDTDSTADATKVLANNGLTLQIGANAGQTMYVSINDMRASALGVNNLNLNTQAGASDAITTIQKAIDQVSTERANLGAYQNRLEHTINNLSTESQNLQSASSQITDVDMAKEMTEFTKNNILTQAAQAMLAQANQLPQGVLSLLK